MRSSRHIVEWHGDRYVIEPLKSSRRVTSLPPVLAVLRRGEFIGTLAYRPEETTKELDARCVAWLRGLLGEPGKSH